MEKITRDLTEGEIDLLKSIYASTIDYTKVKIHNFKAYPFQPDDTAMTPNGEIYFPQAHYLEDFSTANLYTKAWFVHEGAHLFQYYSLKWNVKLRGVFDRNYNYTLDPRKKFQQYGLEEQGDIAQDFFILREGGKITRPNKLSDFAIILPLPQ